jgi:uncharacterized membrane protein YkvA (DUF1232 family)
MKDSFSSLPITEIWRAERFYSRLRTRLHRWLGRHHVEGRLREYLLLLPDLFALLIRLLRDAHIEPALKTQLLLVSAYVISPIDLIPDFLLPMGLVDDTVAVAFVLSRLAAIMGQAGDDLIREYWEGEGDVLLRIQHLLAGADQFLNRYVLKNLRKRFDEPTEKRRRRARK